MIIIQINNIYSKLLNFPNDKDLITDLRELLSYETEEYGYKGKVMTVKKTLFTLKPKYTFPTGLVSYIINYFTTNKILFDIKDEREEPEVSPLRLHGFSLRDYQRKTVHDALRAKRGIVQVATGGGKTVIAACLIARLNCKTLFCVHTKDLLIQAYDTFSKALQVPIGRIGAGYCEIEKINVCMIQTLNSVLGKKYVPLDELDKYKEDSKIFANKAEMLKAIEECECIIVDESQHLQSSSYVNLMEGAKRSFWKFGFSGTPYRNDGRDLITTAYAGKQICKISASFLIRRGFLSKPTIYIVNPLKNKFLLNVGKAKYQTVYKKHIVESERRNSVIAAYAKYMYDKDRKFIVTVNQIKHGKILADMMHKDMTKMELLTGEVSLSDRTELIKQMRSGKLNMIIGTTLCDEGLDIPIVDGLILGGAGKSNVRIPQRIGRTLRLHPDKKDPIIIDFYDNIKFLKGQCRQRMNIYASEPEFKVIKKF